MSNQTNIPQVIIRHISGSKKGQNETFPVTDNLNIRIGRGGDNHVTFDPLTEDVVSRNHCSIKRIREQQDTYEIIDNQSRNGTFVNEQRVNGKVLISCGDLIRLGKDGPVFEFDLNPRPVQKTRVVDTPPYNLSRETKVQDVTSSITSNKEAPKEAVGKETMLYMLEQSEKKGKKGLLVTILALLIIIGTGAWIFFSRPAPQPKIIQVNKGTAESSTKVLTPQQVAKYNNNKVVYIEVGWKLVYTKTGEDLFHVYFPLEESSSKYVAAYIKNGDVIEPYLATKSFNVDGAKLVPIGGFHRASGFVVNEHGFIITNRHVAAAWLTNYIFPPEAFPGLLFETNSSAGISINNSKTVSPQDLLNWIPANAMNINRDVLPGVKLIDGENSYMDVTFANESLRTPAKIVRISSVHDVAMVKIDLPATLTSVSMVDSKDIETGMPVTVLGYPSMSPNQTVTTRSNDAFNRNPDVVSVPVPTLSTGYIGRLVKGKDDKVEGYLGVGDYYQLTINSTGAGNSGGPLYDEEGQVIGIFSATNDKISFAIPIKFAIDLMGTNQVVK